MGKLMANSRRKTDTDSQNRLVFMDDGADVPKDAQTFELNKTTYAISVDNEGKEKMREIGTANARRKRQLVYIDDFGNMLKVPPNSNIIEEPVSGTKKSKKKLSEKGKRRTNFFLIINDEEGKEIKRYPVNTLSALDKSRLVYMEQGELPGQNLIGQNVLPNVKIETEKEGREYKKMYAINYDAKGKQVEKIQVCTNEQFLKIQRTIPSTTNTTTTTTTTTADTSQNQIIETNDTTSIASKKRVIATTAEKSNPVSDNDNNKRQKTVSASFNDDSLQNRDDLLNAVYQAFYNAPLPPKESSLPSSATQRTMNNTSSIRRGLFALPQIPPPEHYLRNLNRNDNESITRDDNDEGVNPKQKP